MQIQIIACRVHAQLEIESLVWFYKHYRGFGHTHNWAVVAGSTDFSCILLPISVCFHFISCLSSVHFQFILNIFRIRNPNIVRYSIQIQNIACRVHAQLQIESLVWFYKHHRGFGHTHNRAVVAGSTDFPSIFLPISVYFHFIFSSFSVDSQCIPVSSVPAGNSQP